MELITLVIIAFIIYCSYIGIKTYIKKKKKQDKLDFKPHIDIDFNGIKQENIETLKLEELRKIYIQLIDVENKIDKSNDHLKDISATLDLLAFFIIAPIIIAIILKILGISILSGIL